MEKTNRIVVNATALDRSGALSILLQFYNNIPFDDKYWLIFAPENINIPNKKNVEVVSVKGVKPMVKRFMWDAYGLKKWLKLNSVNPIAKVSLQNTGFRVGKIVPSFIYYHQPIPFYPYKWNLFKSQERNLWFYKYIYPFFIRLFLNKDTKIFVQLDFIKKGFERFFRHPKENVNVYSPSIVTPKTFNNIKKRSSKICLFYPATPQFYKNHRVLSDALKYLASDIEIIFTTAPIPTCQKDNRIRYIGVQPYDEVCEMYNNCDALVFPSFIETFGLPLLEAALLGVPIIASDLPYAREVLSGYEGVQFVEYDNPECWAKAIKGLEKGKRYKPIDIQSRAGWDKLFESITKII